jgi:CRP-like cAMP-binding protein
MESKQKGAFDAQAFLDSAGLARKIVDYRRSETIFTQGDPCESVLYIQKGGVKLSVLSKTGREAVVAIINCSSGLLQATGRKADRPRSLQDVRWSLHRDAVLLPLHLRRGRPSKVGF